MGINKRPGKGQLVEHFALMTFNDFWNVQSGVQFFLSKLLVNQKPSENWKEKQFQVS